LLHVLLPSAHFAISDKPIAQGAQENKEKAKELQEWSLQLDRIDELVLTREELRAHSPNPSRFDHLPYNSRSYPPPHLIHRAPRQWPSQVHFHRISCFPRTCLGPVQRRQLSRR
jgi:hypothetical protein